jgi:hypothetical protein
MAIWRYMSRIDHAKLSRNLAAKAGSGPRPATELALERWRRANKAAKRARRAERRKRNRLQALCS